jgi:hypothetical protein
MTHESPTTPARRAKLQSIIIGPRLHLRLCGELLELAHAHKKLSSDIQFVETRFEVLLALVSLDGEKS